MIIVLLSYKVGLDVIDGLRAAHVDWLKQGVADGVVLMAGRKVPVTGGTFFARGELEAVKAWAATDPFALAGAAEYEFVEIAPSLFAPGLESLGQETLGQ